MAAASPFLPCASMTTIQEIHPLLSSRSFSSFSSSVSPQSATATFSSPRTFCLGRRCRELDRAISAFHGAEPNPPPTLYNSLIKALNRDGLHRRALSVFVLMLQEPTALPDCFTFLLALRACSQLADLHVGEQIHALLLKSGPLPVEEDVSLGNGLIHVYAQCDRIDHAWKVFDRLPTRNTISWNSMIGAYARGEDLVSARELFDKTPERNLVTWNSMMNGYTQCGLPEEALALFLHLQELDLIPDEATVVSVVTAISNLGLLCWGKAAHAYAIRRGFSPRGALGVSLISMYSKCGNIHSARWLFSEISRPNVAHWTAMIAGFAVHGLADAALHLFDEMLRSGVSPNHVTFVSVLTACSHGGLIEEALKILHRMRAQGVDFGREHLGCVVDLLARAGRVKEALSLAGETQTEPEAWTAVISACRRHGESEVAEMAARKLAALEQGHDASYVLLSGVYGEQGRWREFGQTRRNMARRGVDKVPGLSWIEVGGALHQFAAADRSHRRRREIYAALSSLLSHLRSIDTDVDVDFFGARRLVGEVSKSTLADKSPMRSV